MACTLWVSSICPMMVIHLPQKQYIYCFWGRCMTRAWFFSVAYLQILIILISCLAAYWYIYPLLHSQEPDVMVLVALVNLAVNTTDWPQTATVREWEFFVLVWMFLCLPLSFWMNEEPASAVSLCKNIALSQKNKCLPLTGDTSIWIFFKSKEKMVSLLAFK